MREFEPETELSTDDLKPYEFSLRGVAFKAKPRMAPRDFGAWVELVKNLADGTLSEDPFKILSTLLEATLFPDYRKKWRKLMDEDFDLPIKFGTLIEIGNAIVENAAERPSQPPPSSGNSDGNDEARSTENSASRAAAASSLSRPPLA